MTLKRILLIGLFLFIADLFLACCRCDNPPTVEYKRCELEVLNLKYTGADYLPLPVETIAIENYLIQLRFIQKQNTCQIKAGGLFINTALACSCDEPNDKALDRYESIKVFTVQPFDSNHEAESDITEYFTGGRSYESETSLSEYVLIKNSYDTGLTLFESADNMFIKLNSSPDSAITRQFRIEATMTDGRVISELSPAIAIY